MLELLKPFDLKSLIEETDFVPLAMERRSQLALTEKLEKHWAAHVLQQPGTQDDSQLPPNAKTTKPSLRGRAAVTPNHPFFLNKRGLIDSFPYLPASINRIATTNKPVLIAVATNSLHDRLINAEIPALSKHLVTNGYTNKPLRTLGIKENSNYLCIHRLTIETYMNSPTANKKINMKKLFQEAKEKKTAKKTSYPHIPRHYLDLLEVDYCRKGACGASLLCDYHSLFEQCAAGQYDFLVINHSLFLEEFRHTAMLKPAAFSAIVVEETDELEHAVLNILGCQADLHFIYDTLSDCQHHWLGKELIMHGEKIIQEIWQNTDFNQGTAGRYPFAYTENLKQLAGEMSERLEILYHMGDNRQNTDMPILQAFVRSLTAKDDHIYWTAIRNNGIPVKLSLQVNSLPRDLDEKLEHILTRQHSTPVLFTYYGLNPQIEESTRPQHLGAAVPYSYLPASRQQNILARDHSSYPHGRINIYLEKELPHCGAGHPDYETYIRHKGARISEILEQTKGPTLLLFNTMAAMHATWELLRQHSPGPHLLIQQAPWQKDELAGAFAARERVCLLALFREKLELDNVSLTTLIIDELPFPPGDPLYDYRKTMLLEQLQKKRAPSGANPDTASMTLELARQSQRLTGDRSKYSTIAILDSRAAYGPYKEMVAQALPDGNYIDFL